MLRDLDDYLREIDLVNSVASLTPKGDGAPHEFDDEGPILPHHAVAISPQERALLGTIDRERERILTERSRLAQPWKSVRFAAASRRHSWRETATPEERLREQEERRAAWEARRRSEEQERAVWEEQRRKQRVQLAEAEAALDRRARDVSAAKREAWWVEQISARSSPGVRSLEIALPHVVRRFRQRARTEVQLLDDDDFSDLLSGQLADWEGALRAWFLTEANWLAPAVLGAVKSAEHRRIIEAHVVGGKPPTLGLLGIWLSGLRRALGARESSVVAWARASFQSTTSRYQGEQVDTFATLQRKRDNLAHAVEAMRVTYRNPLAHGDEGAPRGVAEYRAFCDLAYGARSLAEWLEIGTNPWLYRAKHFGWLSFLCFGRRVTD